MMKRCSRGGKRRDSGFGVCLAMLLMLAVAGCGEDGERGLNPPGGAGLPGQ